MRRQEKFIEMIRTQGSVYNPPEIKLTEMITDTLCEYEGIPLDEEDYMLLGNAKVKKGDQVLIYKLDDEKYVILGKVE